MIARHCLAELGKMGEMNAEATGDLIEPGTRVDVRSRFDARWAHGFEIAEACPEGYKIKRLSDGTVLPTQFAVDEVRIERRKRGTWWY
jgi:hypothetical protein